MLYVFNVQCAYSVWFPTAVYVVVADIPLPPLAAVYHPLNAHPGIDGCGRVPYAVAYVTPLLVVPFPLIVPVAVDGLL